MCGVAGLLDLAGRPADPSLLERMAASIRHRGPDDAGVHAEGPVGLLNVRLAVIDTGGSARAVSCWADSDEPATIPAMRSADARRRGMGRPVNGRIMNET